MLTEILLKHQIEDMSYEAVGFTGGDLNATNGTAIETIHKCSMVSPDLLSIPEIVTRYGVLVDFAKDIALLIMLVWLGGYLLQMLDDDYLSQYSSMLPFVKRCIVSMIAIICGMQIYKLLMDLNLELSIFFGGSDSLIETISGPFIGDAGCVMTCISATMLIYMGFFYLCRYIFLVVGLGMWVVGWLFWLAGTGHSMGSHKMETAGLFLLQFVVVNIFMGSAMCFVFWMGRLVVHMGTSYGFIGQWGTYMVGLCFVFVSGVVPVVVFLWLMRSPRYMVHKVTGGIV